MSIQATQVQVPGSAVMAGTAAQQKMARLTDAAQKFEGMMMQELMKPLENNQSGGMWGGEDDPNRDSSLDTMSSYGTEAVANALARHGGLGIAKQVVAQVTRLDERTHGHSGISAAAAAALGGAGGGVGGGVGVPAGSLHGGVAGGSAGDVRPLSETLRFSYGRTGAALPEKEPKGTSQVLKFGIAPPMK